MFHTLSCPETHKTLSITQIHKYISDHLWRSAGPNRYRKLAGIAFLEIEALKSPRSAHYNFSTVPSHPVYHHNLTTVTHSHYEMYHTPDCKNIPIR
jgi:hypothetical protein